MRIESKQCTTHGSSKTTINLEDGELVQRIGASHPRKFVIRDDLIRGWGLDTVPVTVDGVSTITIIEISEECTVRDSWPFQRDNA
jgi:hypothetical protein